VTRLFTAALTIQLAELATITLDNKLAEFYPELPDAVHITYRNLLLQRSGLADYTSAPDFAAWRTAPRPRAELLQIIAAGGTHFPPGDRVEINDTNYLLLGYVIEKVREKSYDELLRAQITSKLGLARTYFAGAGTATTLEARSYRWTPQGWQVLPDDDPTVAGGASGVISNAGDLVTFMDAMFASKIVTSYSLASMRDDEGTGAGIALRKNSLAGQTAWGESAQVAAYETAVWHLPDRKITIAWTGNAARVPMDQVLDETLARVFKRAR
jgi:CubicO group peptidase (beta-lactamase class C family)